MKNGEDEEYEATAAALENILHNTPFLQFLYVYQIKEDGCHVVFDFDSVDAETGEFIVIKALSNIDTISGTRKIEVGNI